MARINVTEVEGFDALNKKLKQLPDKVKRKEVLAIQRRLAAPIKKAYAANLPVRKGTLSKSVSVRAVAARHTGGNPSVVVRPGKSGKNNGYYKFMVVNKGAKVGSNKKGSRKGLNTVTATARDRTIAQIGGAVVKEAEVKTAAYVQKAINRLSN